MFAINKVIPQMHVSSKKYKLFFIRTMENTKEQTKTTPAIAKANTELIISVTVA